MSILPNFNFMDYFREVANSAKFQLSAAISFGAALFLMWIEINDPIKITFTVLFLLPISMFTIALCEKAYYSIYKHFKRKLDWANLTPEEEKFIAHYIRENTRTRYVLIYNGTYRDSGIINPLVAKGILYRASNQSEFRGSSWQSMDQYFPFNIHDNAFKFFKGKMKEAA